MRTFLRVAISFLIGLAVAYVAVTGIMFWSMSDKAFRGDGSMAMAIMFAIGPLGGIVGGIVAAIAIPVWLGRRDQARAHAGIPPAKRWPPKVRAAIAAVAWGAAAYLVMLLAFWLFVSGASFMSYWAALAVGLSPLTLGLAAAALAAFIVLRGAARETS